VLGVKAVDAQPSVVTQNLVERTPTCVLFNQVDDGEPALVDVVDNTLANCGSAFFHNARTSLWDVHVARNLVFGGVVFEFEDWSEEQLGSVIEHGYRSNDNHAFGHSAWAFRMDLEAWRELSGLDGQSSTGDPGFVDAEGGDVRLEEDSIARTASIAGGPVGCYHTGEEIIGVRPPE
jgi:hypothetical protein